MDFENKRQHERDARTDDRSPQPAHSEASSAEWLASHVGNQAFGMLAREGAGILPDGRAHPSVETAIAQTRGRGAPLDPGVQERVGPSLGDPLSDVRVHSDAHADALARSVSARAFTTGSDLYFARGEYRPNTSAGDRLLAHELTHVIQQRGAATSGPLTVSQPGDALEAEADQVSGELG